MIAAHPPGAYVHCSGARIENSSHLSKCCVILTDLPQRTPAIVACVEDQGANDNIARRLRELGFVTGEAVEVVAQGPLGGEPLLVQVGFTRFALRRSEARRVRLSPQEGQP